MTDKKNTIAKLDIIAEMATEPGVKQLAKVMSDYVKYADKQKVGFTKDVV